jgi:chemotaxis response regulator CheB
MSQTPTVYFIDDSATMREVIKNAFRRENIKLFVFGLSFDFDLQAESRCFRHKPACGQ